KKDLKNENNALDSLMECRNSTYFKDGLQRPWIRPSRRNWGAKAATSPTVTSVIAPPKSTEGTVPITLAASPDSNEPISFDDPMKMPFTEATRPRMSSGVKA